MILDPGAFALVVRDQVAFEAHLRHRFAGPRRVRSGQPEQRRRTHRIARRLRQCHSRLHLLGRLVSRDRWRRLLAGGARRERRPSRIGTPPAGWGISGELGGNPNADNAVFSMQFEGWQRGSLHGGGTRPARGLGSARRREWRRHSSIFSRMPSAGDPWAQTPPEFLPSAERSGRPAAPARPPPEERGRSPDRGGIRIRSGDWSEVSLPLGVPARPWRRHRDTSLRRSDRGRVVAPIGTNAGHPGVSLSWWCPVASQWTIPGLAFYSRRPSMNDSAAFLPNSARRPLAKLRTVLKVAHCSGCDRVVALRSSSRRRRIGPLDGDLGNSMARRRGRPPFAAGGRQGDRHLSALRRAGRGLRHGPEI